MRTRFSVGLGVLLAAAIAGGASSALGGILSDALDSLGIAPSRYAALAAREDLRDEVAVATAGGRLSNDDRFEILSDAKRILRPDEYQAFKRALDRRWPPPKRKHSANHAMAARKAAPPAPLAEAQPQEGPSLGPVIPAGALLPDRMVPVDDPR